MNQRAAILTTTPTPKLPSRLVAGVSALVALLGNSLACPPAHADRAFVIAVAGPVSGRAANDTERIFADARRAADRINAAGGLIGRQVEVVRADDGCDRAKAEGVARELAAKGVALVLGHPCTNPALAAAAIYGRQNILFIATETRHPSLTLKRAGASIFRLSGRDDQQGQAAGRILARAARAGPVAIIHDRTAYARTLANSAEAMVEAASGSAPITATIVGGDKDYPLVIKKVRQARAIFFAGFPMEAGFLFTALRGAGSDATFLGSDSLATTEFATTFGADAKGVRVLVGTNALEAVAAQAADAIPAANRNSPSMTAIAIEMVATAVTETGAVDGATLAQALSSKPYATRLGPVRFNTNGDCDLPGYDVLEWTGEAWESPGLSWTPPLP